MNLENTEGRPQLPHKVKEGTSTKKVDEEEDWHR